MPTSPTHSSCDPLRSGDSDGRRRASVGGSEPNSSATAWPPVSGPTYPRPSSDACERRLTISAPGARDGNAAMRLSICIPTYNFGAFIGETLESIAAQLQDGVEVVVLDGGSTDETAEVVGAFAQRHPQIRYHRQPERGGIDRDMARTVALA